MLPPELTSRIPKVTSENIACHSVTDGVLLDPNDIMISDGRLNYNLDDQNPVDNVRFYSSNDLDSSFFIPKNQVSLLFPEKVRLVYRDFGWFLRLSWDRGRLADLLMHTARQFEERVIRVYSRNASPEIQKAILVRLLHWMRSSLVNVEQRPS